MLIIFPNRRDCIILSGMLELMNVYILSKLQFFKIGEVYYT